MNAFPSSAGTNTKKIESAKFNTLGMAIATIFLWVTSQSATGDTRKMINGFLGVLLLSMILLNWSKIKPIFFK